MDIQNDPGSDLHGSSSYLLCSMCACLFFVPVCLSPSVLPRFLPVVQSLPDVAADVKCFDGALVVSFSIPDFEFKTQEVRLLSASSAAATVKRNDPLDPGAFSEAFTESPQKQLCRNKGKTFRQTREHARAPLTRCCFSVRTGGGRRDPKKRLSRSEMHTRRTH